MHNENKVFSPKNMSKLEHPDRYREMSPEMILKKLDLKSGQTFGDFGCGIGFFSIPAALNVGANGHVFASDISVDMLNGLKERLPEEHVNRVSFCLASSKPLNATDGPVNGTGIDSNILDRAMISMVLHEVDSPEAFLDTVGKSVKTGGKLAIVEWIKQDMPHGPKLSIRISESEMEVLLQNTGFKMENTIQLSERFYLMIAQKV